MFGLGSAYWRLLIHSSKCGSQRLSMRIEEHGASYVQRKCPFWLGKVGSCFLKLSMLLYSVSRGYHFQVLGIVFVYQFYNCDIIWSFRACLFARLGWDKLILIPSHHLVICCLVCRGKDDKSSISNFLISSSLPVEKIRDGFRKETLQSLIVASPRACLRDKTIQLSISTLSPASASPIPTLSPPFFKPKS